MGLNVVSIGEIWVVEAKVVPVISFGNHVTLVLVGSQRGFNNTWVAIEGAAEDIGADILGGALIHVLESEEVLVERKRSTHELDRGIEVAEVVGSKRVVDKISEGGYVGSSQGDDVGDISVELHCSV